ncbi:MAG: DUF2284 domain-containing protein [Ruminococcaceae bacterium]|nr:DUF2284 domain-containing protein [Oscillospiraceae bacterium]
MKVFTEKALIERGIKEYAFIDPKNLEFSEDIQKLCNNGACRMYNKTWACPPAIGDAEECRKRCNGYREALLFSSVYELEDSFDYEGMVDAGVRFRELCDELYLLCGADSQKYLVLCNGACIRCEKCTYPDSPCRFPEKLFLSLEGHGINVSLLAKSCGMKYINGKDTVTYFGMILCK